MINRKDGRSFSSIRPVKFQINPFGYSDGSVFYEQGQTKVYVSVSVQEGVPRFLKGKRKGWLTAEYAMHPHSSGQGRMQRELSSATRNFRSVEISRLIGRSFRSVVDLEELGEKTIFIDCDVLQADGGTRTACISAASIALSYAQKEWISKGFISKEIISQRIAAVSVGMVQANALLDIDCSEDLSCDADFNFVLNDKNMVIEVQGTAEKYPLAWTCFDELKSLAEKGISQILEKTEI